LFRPRASSDNEFRFRPQRIGFGRHFGIQILAVNPLPPIVFHVSGRSSKLVVSVVMFTEEFSSDAPFVLCHKSVDN